jgi:PAS domain S-box-containing protein
MLEQDNISRIKILLKAHPRGLTITDVSSNLKMNRNSAAKYLEILQISGLVESKSYGTARVFFLTHRLPISALVSISPDLVITLDEGHHILFVNESFCTFFTIKTEDIAGSHILEIFKTGIGGTVLPGIFSDIIAGKEGVHEVRLPRDTGDIFFKIKSMKTVFDDGSRGITIIMEDVTRETKDKIELEAKEARYRGIVEDQTEFVVRFVPDGTLSFVNSAFSQYLNKRPEELIGTPLIDTVYDQDRNVFERSLQSLNQKNPVDSFKCRIGRQKKPVRWCSWTLRALFDDQKDAVEYQAVGHDITTQKKEEDRIEQQFNEMEFFSTKLQQFIELAPDADIYQMIGTGFSEILPVAAICVSSYDPTTSSLMIKAVCSDHDHEVFTKKIGRDIIGLKIPVGEGGPCPDLLSGRIFCRKGNLFDIARGELAEPICAGIEESLNLGEYHSAGMIWRGTLLGAVTFSVRKAGVLENVTLAETYLRAASIALQRSFAEKALIESENLYRSVLANIQDVYYRSDLEGNLLMISPSGRQMLGYSLSDTIEGKNIAKEYYLNPERRKDLVNEITAKGSVSNYEVVLKRQDGTPVFIETNSHFYYDRNGSPLGIEGIFRDISERKAATKKIHQYIEDMEFFSQKLLDFIMMDPGENIFDRIVADLKALIPGSMIMVNSFDSQSGLLTVRSIAMSELQREEIFRALGRDLIGCDFPVDSRGLSAFRTGRLEHGDLSLFEIVFRSIPEPVCERLESELEIGEKYTIGFVRRGEIMGNATIFLDKKKTITDTAIVEMYAREAAIALQKYIADEARRKSDEKYRILAENATDIVWILNLATGKFTYFSPAVEKIRGYTAEEAVELPLEKTLTPESFAMAKAELKKTLELDKQGLVEYDRIRVFEFELYCKDGSIIFTETTMKFLRNAEGVPVSLMGITRDITERRKAEQVLKESEEKFRALVELSLEGILITDFTGKILFGNQTAGRIIDAADYQAMIGVKNVLEFVAPESHADVLHDFSQVAQGIDAYLVHYKLITESKREIWVECIGKKILFRESEAMLVSMRDITERKRAEEALHESQQLLSSIVESTDDAVIGKDIQGTVVSWNRSAERIYGYTAGEMIGRKISIIIPPDRLLEWDESNLKIQKGQSINNLETKRIRKDGKIIDVAVTISPISNGSGKIIGASTIARDITPLKADERLSRNEENYRSLVEDISVGMYRSTGDPTGHFIWGNSSLVKILGYPSFEQLKGVDIADIFVESEGRKKLLAELKKDGFVKNREITLKRADGETVSVRVTALAQFDTGGGLSCINGIVEDTTSQRLAEQRIQIINKRMDDVLTFIQDPIVIIDHKNTVVAWNAAMEQLTGVQKTGVLGRSDFDHLLPYHEQSRPPLFTFLDEPEISLQRYYPGAYREGSTIVAQVGRLISQEDPSGFFTVRVFPLTDTQGARIGAVQIIRSAATDSNNSTP